MVSPKNVKVMMAFALSLAGSARAACELMWPAASGDTCDAMSSDWGISLDDFIALNPPVGSGCVNGVQPGVEYCVAGEVGPAPVLPPLTTTTSSSSLVPTLAPMPTTFSTRTSTRTSAAATTTTGGRSLPSPIQDGVVSECKHFYKVVEGDDCDVVVRKHASAFTETQFKSWNTKVGDDCEFLWLDFYVCVGVDSAPPPTTALPPQTGPTPIQPGTSQDCTEYYKVLEDDNCDTVVEKHRNRFPKEQFFQWNPEVGGQECGNLWTDYHVCVGASKRPSDLVQPGVVANCNDFYMVQPGKYCSAIVDLFGGRFSLDQFHSWNPEAGRDCTNLWTGYWVCVGTA